MIPFRFTRHLMCEVQGGGEDRSTAHQRGIRRTYSSWLNQVEISFARIEREVIARGVFTSVHDLVRKLMRYIRAYSKTARPFQWKYTDVRRRMLSR